MAEYAPHYNLFKIINRIGSFNKFIWWVILASSIIPIVLKDYLNTDGLLNIINILNIIGISLFFILEIICDLILIPHADNKRRDDFIDNSFGSSFSTSSSIAYYDNDEVNKGLYKAAVNLFENVFFSYSLVKATTITKIFFPSIIVVVMAIFSYYGLKEVPYALSVLQALFSANILGLLIKHLIMLNRLSTIQDYWISLFQHEDMKLNTVRYQSYIYRYWLQYEALQSKINSDISERLYIRLNPILSQEWHEIKKKYNIN
jgi:hypothetical protein